MLNNGMAVMVSLQFLYSGFLHGGILHFTETLFMGVCSCPPCHGNFCVQWQKPDQTIDTTELKTPSHQDMVEREFYVVVVQYVL